MEATVLDCELVEAGFDRSYPTLVRELRRLELRPVCLVCEHRRGDAVAVEIDHPAGEEIQRDRLELSPDDVPWDGWSVEVADARSRPTGTVGQLGAAEPFRPLPAAAYPAVIAVERRARRWWPSRPTATAFRPRTLAR